MTSRKTDRPLTEAELEARRRNAQHSTGPRTEAGKAISSRNGWKHGLTSRIAKQSFRSGAESIAQLFGKPCLRTCPMHPANPDREPDAPVCGLVVDGLTDVGGNCLDKTVYVNAFAAIMDALHEGNMDGMHGMMAAETAAMIQLFSQLRSEVSRTGLLVRVPLLTKEGNVVTGPDGEILYGDYKINPGLSQLTFLMDKLGISLPELLVTPQSQSRAKTGEKAADTFQSLLGGIMQRSVKPAAPSQPALPHEEGG